MKFIETVAIAEKKLRTIFPATPLHYSEFLSERYDAKIYLKREDLSPVRSYKLRGAFNLVSQILENNIDSQIFVCASAGNHSQGFAFACAHFKVPGVVFMPLNTPQQKIEKTKAFGGSYLKIKLVGNIFDEAYQASKVYCEKENGTLVPPFDHPQIIEGQATLALEVLAQTTAPIDLLLMPVGGGGLSAGLAQYFHERSPKTKLICCEPQGAASLKDNLENNVHRPLPKIDPFVDGASVAFIGQHNFQRLRRYINQPVEIVPENRLCSTILEFLNREGIVLEPAGALAIDALKNFPAAELKGQHIVCIASGGNFDFTRLAEVKERSVQYEKTQTDNA